MTASGPVADADPNPPAATGLRLRRIDLRGDALAGDATAARQTIAGLARRGAVPASVRDGARAIVADVRERADAAVQEANARFGGGLAGGGLVIGPAELAEAAEALEPDVRAALDQAIANVRRFAEPQRPIGGITTIAPGVEIERRWTPTRRVGAYVPGGSAPYPSSLVMTVVPARVAGVAEVVVATPADATGRVHPVLLGAAGLLGVDAVLVAGGAQAIGALAHGLAGVGLDPVNLIVGPGNAWVTAAKLEVLGDVAIDLPAGPSEGMVLADASADPRIVAADLITQAEHGPDSPAILVTTDSAFADAVEAAIGVLLATADRAAILVRSLGDHGAIVLAPDLAAAIHVVNGYAPEHLSVDVEDVEDVVARITSAGSIFVGPWAPESAGDYATGANHVLPTGGLARACGALSVETYGRYSQVQRIDRAGLLSLRDTIATLATTEGLTAHRDAVEIRFRIDDEAAAAAARDGAR